MARLMKERGLKGTFYVPITYEQRGLSDNQVAELCRDFEIGSHSLTHRRLTDLPDNEVDRELSQSKATLEDITGQEIMSFCYPFGDFDLRVKSRVEIAGYRLARTTNYNYGQNASIDQFSMSVSSYLSRSLSVNNLLELARILNIRLPLVIDWECKAKILFDMMLRRGGIFHLWGHSWDLGSRIGRLTRVLDFISNRDNCVYLDNFGIMEGFRAHYTRR